MKSLNPILIGNKEVLPLIEGGKGISATNGISSGAWAKTGGIGTFSGVNADYYDHDGNVMPQIYKGKTRLERHEELIQFGIQGGIAQAQIAHDVAEGQGMINMNILWEMGEQFQYLMGSFQKQKD